MAEKDLFNGYGKIQPHTPTAFCKTCKHRQPWACGGRNIQYCGVRKSKRTTNGLLKIKTTNPACELYLEGKNYWEEIKENKKKTESYDKGIIVQNWKDYE